MIKSCFLQPNALDNFLKATKHLNTFKKLVELIKIPQNSIVPLKFKIILLNAAPTCPEVSLPQRRVCVKLAGMSCDLYLNQQMCFNKHLMKHLKPEDLWLPLQTRTLSSSKDQAASENVGFTKILGSAYYAQVCSGELTTQKNLPKKITKSLLSYLAAQACLGLLNSENATFSTKRTLKKPRFESLGAVIAMFEQTFFISAAELKQTLVLLNKTLKPDHEGLNRLRKILLKSKCGVGALIKTRRNLKNKFTF